MMAARPLNPLAKPWYPPGKNPLAKVFVPRALQVAESTPSEVPSTLARERRAQDALVEQEAAPAPCTDIIAPAASFHVRPTIITWMPGLAPCRPLPAARPTFTARISVAGLVLVSPSLPKPALVARKLAVPRITAASRPQPAAPKVLLALPAPLVQAAAGAAVKEEEEQQGRSDVDCPNAVSMELHGLTVDKGLRIVDAINTVTAPSAHTGRSGLLHCMELAEAGQTLSNTVLHLAGRLEATTALVQQLQRDAEASAAQPSDAQRLHFDLLALQQQHEQLLAVCHGMMAQHTEDQLALAQMQHAMVAVTSERDLAQADLAQAQAQRGWAEEEAAAVTLQLIQAKQAMAAMEAQRNWAQAEAAALKQQLQQQAARMPAPASTPYSPFGAYGGSTTSMPVQPWWSGSASGATSLVQAAGSSSAGSDATLSSSTPSGSCAQDLPFFPDEL